MEIECLAGKIEAAGVGPKGQIMSEFIYRIINFEKYHQIFL